MEIIKTRNYDVKKFTLRKNSQFYWSQRWDVIVNHITAGYMPGVLDYMTRPDTNVSAHFLITRVGKVYQQTGLEHGAWHCLSRTPSSTIVKSRVAPPNLYTVGIEHEGMVKYTNGRLTEAQYKATFETHKYIIEQYEKTFNAKFPIDRQHIIGHYETDTVNRSINDPGREFPFARLIKDLQTWKNGGTVSFLSSEQTPTVPSFVDQKMTLIEALKNTWIRDTKNWSDRDKFISAGDKFWLAKSAKVLVGSSYMWDLVGPYYITAHPSWTKRTVYPAWTKQTGFFSVRKDRHSTSTILTKVEADTKFAILEVYTDGWTRVFVNGKEGYARTAFLYT